MSKTNYLMIIGAMKAGTTTLFDYLCKHPNICRSIKKESQFFTENESADYSQENYDTLFHYDENIHLYKMDGSTGYTKYPKQSGVPQRIFDSGLRPKFIYIVRNPLDRINSEINFLKNHLRWNRSKIISNLNFMIDRSDYFLQMEQYVNLFPKTDILILDFDDLKKESQTMVDEVCSFLDLPLFKIKVPKSIPNKTESKSDVELKIIKNYSNVLNFIPVPVKTFVKKRINMMSNTSNWQLTSEEKNMVRNKLVDHMVKFEEHYGFKVNKWGF